MVNNMCKLILALLLVLPIYAQSGPQPTLAVYTSISDMLARANPRGPQQAVQVLGYTSPGDGGGGSFYATNVIGLTNSGTRFRSSLNSTYAWVRVMDDVLTPKIFGAVADGVTDDTLAIQAALDGLRPGQQLYFPAGTYKTSDTLLLKTNGCTIFGDGPDFTIISNSGTNSVFANADKTTLERSWWTIKQIKLASATTNGTVLDLTFCREFVIERCWISGGAGSSLGIRVQGLLGTADATYNYIRDCYIGLVHDGILLTDQANSCRIQRTRIQPIGGKGVWLNTVNNVTVTDCSFEYPGAVSTGIYAAGNVDGVWLDGNRFESMGIGIYLETGSLNVSVGAGNYYSSNGTNVYNASLSATVLQNNTIKILDLLLKRDDTEGFSVNQSIIVPAMNATNVADGGDRLTFDTGESEFRVQSFRGDTGFGLWKHDSTNGWQRTFRIDSGGAVRAGKGTSALPGLTFIADPDTGLYYGTNANTLGFSTAGKAQWEMGSDGVLLPQATNDIGSSSLRFGVGYFTSLNLPAGGVQTQIDGKAPKASPTFTGTVTLSGLPSYADNAAALAGGLVAGNLYRLGDTVGIVH